MKKDIFLILGTLLLITLITFSSALSITPQTKSQIIVPDLNQPAEFELTISGSSGTHSIYTLSDVKILPSQFTLVQGTSQKIRAFVYPTSSLTEKGFYTFTYNINADLEKLYTGKFTVKIMDLKDLFEINSDSNNLDTGAMKFYIKNKENTNLNNIKIEFSSIFFKDIQKTLNFEPYEKKEIEVLVDKEELKTIAAGSYLINAEIETKNGKEKIDGTIFLGEKKEITAEEDISGFLIKTQSITRFNTGNVNEIVNIKIERGIISRLFTSFNNQPDSVIREGFSVTYSWTEELTPSEIFVVRAKTNYILPFLILIIAGFLIYTFKKYTQTKIEIIKSVSHVKTKTGHFALKVTLKIRAKKQVENVSLIDKIPAVVKVYEKFDETTNKPTKIDAANRRIQWDVGNMDLGEERVFSYIVYSKIGVVGKFSLPEALAVFEKEGEIHEVESNKVFFLSEQTSKDED
jgi:hypothetical protein